MAIRGRRYRIAGRVCMDQFVVDLGPVTECVVGDTVTLIGPDGPSAREWADAVGTIDYEIVCRFGGLRPQGGCVSSQFVVVDARRDAGASRATWWRRSLRAGDLLILTGDLGAGKTTFTQGLGDALGVRGPIASPTFIIARTHPSLVDGPRLIHVDAYRLGVARRTRRP